MADESIFPIVHLNGTHPAALMEACMEARVALRASMKALDRMAPHERDYYPYGDRKFFLGAVAQHDARMARIDGVLRELTLYAEYLIDTADDPFSRPYPRE